MASNFSFFQQDFPGLYELCTEAEKVAISQADVSLILSRKCLEAMVKSVYKIENLAYPALRDEKAKPTLGVLLFNGSFLNHTQLARYIITDSYGKRHNTGLMQSADIVLHAGNDTIHLDHDFDPRQSIGKSKSNKAKVILRNLHNVATWFYYRYAGADGQQVNAFDPTLVKPVSPTVPVAELEKLDLDNLKVRKSNKELKKQLLSSKPHVLVIDEKQTRKDYIDLALMDAGWDLDAANVKEYPLVSGKRADYVLWGDDGKPLAVVEAKRTMHDPQVGQGQAEGYANELEQQFGQRPVIFFTNGLTIWLWDDHPSLTYVPRPVQGFYRREELERLISRRERKPLLISNINNTIIDRLYQTKALESIAEAFSKEKTRAALLVMATGSGKTRTAAALADFLSKAHWVKNVLFLADRDFLVTQAKADFTQYLTEYSLSDLRDDKDPLRSRIVFSTYQTLHNVIDGAREKDGSRTLGPGFFDLIVFDEIHRSVYNKYKAIFYYFDGFKVGLTATPKKDKDKNTYRIFGLEDKDPTYSFELEDGVALGVLKPFKRVPVQTKFYSEGITYKDLKNDEEKAHYEEKFTDPDTGEIPDAVAASQVHQWIMNKDTVRMILEKLMEKGLRVAGGQRIGKTIIFVSRREHALFMMDVFNEMEPKDGGKLLRVIDGKDKSRYDDFRTAEKLPQIAITEDLLETGVNIPEIVNLVFCKPVRSYTKFWQMLGRGTRPVKDLFGPGLDKHHFLVFDWCHNFEFFDENPEIDSSSRNKTLGERYFNSRLKLGRALIEQKENSLHQLGCILVDELQSEVRTLDIKSYAVKAELSYVEKYKSIENWYALAKPAVRDIIEHISPLVRQTTEADNEEDALRFDTNVMTLQEQLLTKDPEQELSTTRIKRIAEGLLKKRTMPSVLQKEPLIRSLLKDEYWANVTLPQLEEVRKELRDLVRHVDKEYRTVIYTNFTDTFTGNLAEEEVQTYASFTSADYKRRMESLIYQHKNDLVIQKIRTAQPITVDEANRLSDIFFAESRIQDKEAYLKALDGKPLTELIRRSLGLDQGAANEIFNSFAKTHNATTEQFSVLELLINSYISNGIVEKDMLYESPFIDDGKGLDNFPDKDRKELLQLIDRINQSIQVA
ncbi:type I restriction endonuclease subunit R [Dawidia soli]|uniref:DEAD/DEAH box helicase family protein n=1 Tax=Dawidia soli TaxID=2782352 RepID=A0AAP2GKA9_9BACT|nr:DEAD/DEAH box helicase family protein [Dawidia soli]MBT1689435.1 DEAD/DEAH box helicase family protein [Dawidia soli]